jgi:preprotein translocase subunit SecG
MWLNIVIPILLSILAIVCILLTLVVLMQRPKNEGLGAAFGSGVTENIFGAQTATVLTKATVYLGCIFFGLTLLLTVLTARQSSNRRVGVLESEVRKAAALPKTTTSPAVVASPTTAASPAAAASPQASAGVTVSATPAASSSPEPSTTPSGSVSPSPSVTTESSPTAAPSAASSTSPQH